MGAYSNRESGDDILDQIFMGKFSNLPSLNGAETLPQKIYASLEEAILQGKVKPGDRLIEDDLSSRFGISRGPIREAFRLMERDGLIQVVPRKGAIVKSISLEDISEIYEIVSALEGLAAKLFCERAPQKELELNGKQGNTLIVRHRRI
ncbi:MAG: hypothetical protein A2170_10685 [Deltaproteobacteria bacterium RBG_13_53_10]|nr:MAG: hypothetical protein A2170_10685 [Deltaproteobacteria bacterium RBG_13_53_10]